MSLIEVYLKINLPGDHQAQVEEVEMVQEHEENHQILTSLLEIFKKKLIGLCQVENLEEENQLF